MPDVNVCQAAVSGDGIPEPNVRRLRSGTAEKEHDLLNANHHQR